MRAIYGILKKRSKQTANTLRIQAITMDQISNDEPLAENTALGRRKFDPLAVC